MHRKATLGILISIALGLTSCNQANTPLPEEDVSQLVIQAGGMTSITEGQYKSISDLMRSGKKLNEIVKVVHDNTTLSPLYTSLPSDGPCSSASRIGRDGSVTSRSSGVFNTYTMSIKMTIASKYTNYEGNVYVEGNFQKTYYASSFAVPIPTGKSVQLDALATGPYAYAVGQLYCRT